jgi:hypothetical protein
VSWDYAFGLLITTGILVYLVGSIIRHNQRQQRRSSVSKERPSLDDWMMDQTLANPRANLGDLLDRYIAQYDVTVRATLDEPRSVSDARTKLQLLQSSVFGDTDSYPNPQLQAYKMGLETIIMAYDEADEEIRERLRARETE